jgi:hypothetical protein
VRIIETKTVDSPAKRFSRDRVAQVEAEKRQVRALAKKFGWKIQEGRKTR